MESGSKVPYAVGVDYFACTVRPENDRKKFQELCVALLDEQQMSGNVCKPWSFHGYQGFRCGPVEYGSRYEDDLARISGSEADRVYMALAGFASTVPRLDLQTTIWDQVPVLPRLRSAYARASSRPNGPRARPVFDLRQTTIGGSTLYVGRRQSDAFGRIYDTYAKHKEKEWQGSIRYEVQFQNRRASQTLALLQSGDLEGAQAAGFVLRWFEERFRSLRSAWVYLCTVPPADFSASSPIIGCLPRRKSDDEKSLVCARKQWRKVSQRLVAAGLGPDLLDCLGLSISAEGELVVSK